MVSRRRFITSTAASGIAVAGAETALAATPRRPNFVIFLADDLGCHDLGCAGASDLQTPNIDALAANGVRFTNWYAAAPVCAPSRSAVLTGRYPLRNGVTNNSLPLAPTERTIASLLKPAGYATGIFGKWHLGASPDTVPNAHGFDEFVGFHAGCIDYYSHRFYWGEPRTVNYHDFWRNREEIFPDGNYSTEIFGREAARFVRNNRDNPFFLYVPFNAVHYPMHAPARYVERFSITDTERRMYAAMLAALDDGVGEVMRALRDTGLLDRTLVFCSADNGATTEARAGLHGMPATAGSNRPFRGYKFSVFDGGMHPPAIMSWPGVVPKGRVVNEVGSHLDLLPTILTAAGVDLPTDRVLDGFDALPLAAGSTRSRHDAIFWSEGPQVAVRRGKWKLVKNGITHDGTEAGRKPLPGDDAFFLSDVESDPGESTNLRHAHPEIVDEMVTLTERWLQDVKSQR